MSLTLARSDTFINDLERQLDWYVHESKLDLADGLALANNFNDAVFETLEFLLLQPNIGRRRFPRRTELAGTRSWRVKPPFNRFLIYYYIRGETLSAERLIEGHREITTDKK